MFIGTFFMGNCASIKKNVNLHCHHSFNKGITDIFRIASNWRFIYFRRKQLAELEKEHEVTVITQNVNHMHERAGSTRVIHSTASIGMKMLLEAFENTKF